MLRNQLKDYSNDNLVICDIKNEAFRISGNIIHLLNNEVKDNVDEITMSWDDIFSMICGTSKEKILKKWVNLLNKQMEIIKEFKVRVTKKEIIYISLKLKPFFDINGELNYYCGYMHDVTKLKKAEQSIKKLIEIDIVTKLPSKYYVKNVIDNYLVNCEKERIRGALILINIDNFKIINDSFGHEEGDLLLEKVANELLEVISEEDLICRYNADEYIIFKPDIDTIEKSEAFLRDIKSIFKSAFSVNNQKIYITSSIGVSIFPDNGMNFNTLLKNADAAMYRAKSNGKDEWEFFNNSISNELSRIYDIQKGLRMAIERDELFVVFQPKVVLVDSKVNGFEALLRWNSKELGVVSPLEFIPIAESTRLIIPIGRFVLEEVFKKVKYLLQEGYDDFKVAVNFSDVQLRYGTIVEDFTELMEEYGVPSKYIEVEITESVLMKTFDDNIKRLDSIKNLGVTVALDDFGTGYSSLNYLTKLPIDVLKIDRSFVMDLFNNRKCRCIVENIIKLSHELGINVVAEGVEDQEQVDYLKEILCDVVQGYYYSKPEKFDDIKCLLGKILK